MKDYEITESKGIPVVSSRNVAEMFNKRHDHILRDIENLAPQNWGAKSEVTQEFWNQNFHKSSYRDRGKRYPEYLMTKDGFTLLAMGFNGKKAMEFKITYINQFNLMEQTIKVREAARIGHPAFTESIKLAHDPVQRHHFSNESDMINRLVLGATAKQFKEMRQIPKDVQSIRPWLTLNQIEEVEYLQMLDTGMNAARLTYDQRKASLEYSLMKRREQRIKQLTGGVQ